MLREKLSVLQKQTVATRVGMVQALCASLIGPGRFQPVETYLAGTSLAGARNAEPDWQRLDYADLVGAESQRSGTFGHAVGTRLAELRGRLTGKGAADAVAVLAETLGDGAVRRDGDTVTWLAPAALGEFVGNPVGEAVSAGHADWLAVLLWIEEAGGALRLQREGDAISARAGVRTETFASDRLAVWIEQLSD